MPLTRRNLIASGLCLPVILSFASALHAAESAPIYAEGGIAIDGSDPVAYFTDGAPVPGGPSITAEWNGATWRFASEENRATFLGDPEAYAPQYGGYCAWAVAEGYTAPTDPSAWRIEDGKLYLNYSKRVQRQWERDIPGNIQRGDKNWPKLFSGS